MQLNSLPVLKFSFPSVEYFVDAFFAWPREQEKLLTFSEWIQAAEFLKKEGKLLWLTETDLSPKDECRTEEILNVLRERGSLWYPVGFWVKNSTPVIWDGNHRAAVAIHIYKIKCPCLMFELKR